MFMSFLALLIIFPARQHSCGKDSLWRKIIYFLMLLCVTGLGSKLVRVTHNSDALHMHIHISVFSSTNLLK